MLPPGTTRNSMVDSCIFDRMLDTVAEIESKEQDCSFIICGDMNACTGESDDYLTDDNLQHVPLPEDYTLDENITPRFSLDKNASNANGNMLLSFCNRRPCALLIQGMAQTKWSAISRVLPAEVGVLLTMCWLINIYIR